MKGVLVTGAGVRIGAEVARHLSRLGWHVIIHARRNADAAEALRREILAEGGAASVVTGDLSDGTEALIGILDASLRACKDLTALINSAAEFEYDDPRTVTADRLERYFRVNTVAPVMLTKLLAERLPEHQEGCTINIVDNRVFAPNPDYFSYSVSKYALYGATRMLALSLAPRMRVAGIAPGITLVSGKQSEANFDQAHAMNPLRRGCTPDQIARAAEFILTTPSYNGQVVTIDGGESLAPFGRDVAYVDPLVQ